MLASQHADKILKALGNSTGSLDCEHRELLHCLMEQIRESDGPSTAALMLLRHLSRRTVASAAAVAHA